jgi:hypothetical protein
MGGLAAREQLNAFKCCSRVGVAVAAPTVGAPCVPCVMSRQRVHGPLCDVVSLMGGMLWVVGVQVCERRGVVRVCAPVRL